MNVFLSGFLVLVMIVSAVIGLYGYIRFTGGFELIPGIGNSPDQSEGNRRLMVCSFCVAIALALVLLVFHSPFN